MFKGYPMISLLFWTFYGSDYQISFCLHLYSTLKKKEDKHWAYFAELHLGFLCRVTFGFILQAHYGLFCWVTFVKHTWCLQEIFYRWEILSEFLFNSFALDLFQQLTKVLLSFNSSNIFSLKCYCDHFRNHF